jgi:hypothetical protein
VKKSRGCSLEQNYRQFNPELEVTSCVLGAGEIAKKSRGCPLGQINSLFFMTGVFDFALVNQKQIVF